MFPLISRMTIVPVNHFIFLHYVLVFSRHHGWALACSVRNPLEVALEKAQKASSIIPTDGGWVFEPVHCSISWGETFFWVEAAEYSLRLPFSYFLKYMLAVSLYQMNLFITFLSKTTVSFGYCQKKKCSVILAFEKTHASAVISSFTQWAACPSNVNRTRGRRSLVLLSSTESLI